MKKQLALGLIYSMLLTGIMQAAGPLAIQQVLLSRFQTLLGGAVATITVGGGSGTYTFSLDNVSSGPLVPSRRTLSLPLRLPQTLITLLLLLMKARMKQLKQNFLLNQMQLLG